MSTFPPTEHPANTHKPEIISLLNDWRKSVYTDIAALEVAPTIITPTLAGSWADYGTGFQAARYWKDQHGIVHLEGLVKSGSGTIFTLNSGYRPAATNIFSVIGNNLLARVDAQADGVVLLSTGSNLFLQLSGITFLAA